MCTLYIYYYQIFYDSKLTHRQRVQSMDFHPQVDVLKLIDVTDTDRIGGLHSKIIKNTYIQFYIFLRTLSRSCILRLGLWDRRDSKTPH